MHQVVRAYGWPDSKGRTSFRHTIWGESSRGFKIVNDTDRIIVRNIGPDADPDITPPYWTHDSLMNAFVYKMRRLAVVHGTKRKGKVRYEYVRLYQEPKITNFINAIERGLIAIDFDARTELSSMALRDHGTKFRIKLDDLHSIYTKNEKFAI